MEVPAQMNVQTIRIFHHKSESLIPYLNSNNSVEAFMEYIRSTPLNTPIYLTNFHT